MDRDIANRDIVDRDIANWDIVDRDIANRDWAIERQCQEKIGRKLCVKLNFVLHGLLKLEGRTWVQ